MPKPRSDFLCLSKKCETPKGATAYELPIDATHCPRGHKRLKRIYAANINARPKAKKIDRMLQPEYERQKAKKDAARPSTHGHPGVVVGRASQAGALLARATGMPQFAAASVGDPSKPARVGEGVYLGSALPRGEANIPAREVIRGRPRPAAGSLEVDATGRRVK